MSDSTTPAAAEADAPIFQTPRRGRPWLAPLVVGVLVATVVVVWAVTRTPGGDDEPWLVLDYPALVDTYEPMPVSAKGHTGPLTKLAPGPVVGVYMPKEALTSCPDRLPVKDTDHWVAVLHGGVPGQGPVRSAGLVEAPSSPGFYRLCAYLESGKTGKSLVASEVVKVEESSDLPELSSGETLPAPGIYAASGPDGVDSDFGDARVEFEVVADGEFGRATKWVAATQVPVGPCDADGKPKLASRYAEPTAAQRPVSLQYLGWIGDLALVGGAPRPGEVHGTVGPGLSGSGCKGQLAFVAKRVASGATPLRDQLKKEATR